MNHSKNSSSKNSKKFNKALAFFLIALSFVGFLVSAYLTAEHYSGGVPPCSLVEGCEVVTTSQYSAIAGMPISIFGVLYFLALIILLIAYADSGNKRFLKLAFIANIPGAGMAIALIALQAFVIKAFCIYCLTVDISSLVIFVGMAKIFWYNKNK